jgi:hypothetical protein
MSKFTVVIPTIWKSEYTLELIKRYCECECVEEVLLINNRKEDTPILIQNSKLKVYDMEENIFVNPAWNYGVTMANTDYITISNDDILYNVDEYYELLNQIISQQPLENLGYIGSHSENYIISENKTPILEQYDNQTNKGGWGCLFTFHKQNWKTIPEQLKIWYGDNWIHMVARPILQLSGINIETKMSTSSDLEEIREVRDNDTKEWHKLLSL